MSAIASTPSQAGSACRRGIGSDAVLAATFESDAAQRPVCDAETVVSYQ